ncbi:MAG TPA: FtsX-like permease family protein [Nocardioides sp.]|nr:FtsX-like permease family protein [Nocardioides sp.]
MFLAVRELRFARARFALMGAVVALIAVLMVLLSGLSVGLVDDGVSGLQKMPVTSFAFEEDVPHDTAFSRSVVPLSAVDEWARQPGVRDAAPFGNTLANAHSDRGLAVDLALFGVEPGSFVDPAPAEGEGLGADPLGIVVSETLLDQGLRIGDTVTIDRIGTELHVVGAVDGQHTYGHVDIAYVPLETWQQVRVGARPGEQIPSGARDEVTAVAVRADGEVDLAGADRAARTESLSKEASYGASPGYTAETSTLMLIQVFLYAISALVVGAFFTVWTIQRRQEIAVMRAMGAPTGYLLRDSLVQSLLLLVASAATGVAVGVGGGVLIDGTSMPFALSAPSIAIAATLLVVLGLAGAAAAVVRIVRVDPLTALGGSR